jgi:hypothetical protein
MAIGNESLDDCPAKAASADPNFGVVEGTRFHHETVMAWTTAKGMRDSNPQMGKLAAASEVVDAINVDADLEAGGGCRGRRRESCFRSR